MRPLVIALLFLISCSRTTETHAPELHDHPTASSEKILSELDVQDSFPDYVKNTVIPDSLLLDVDHVIYGDFNADQKDDFASIVTNLENGFQGVLIIHNGGNPEYQVFGAGQEVNGMKNLDWVDIFKTLPKGEVIEPTRVDPNTGDIIGPDSIRQFRLIGDGIYMHVDEADGGGILFWTGNKYEWYHLE